MFSVNLPEATPKPKENPKTDKKKAVTPLDFFEACKTGNLKFVQECVRNSETIATLVNKANESGLLLACKNGHYEIARLLIRSKADLNCCDLKNHSAVHYAIINKHHKLLELLIKNNANISDYDKTDTYTPLILAIQDRDYFAVHMLLNTVDLNVKNQKREDIFDYVISGSQVSSNTKFIFTSHPRTRDEFAKRKQIYEILLSKSMKISQMDTKQMRAYLANNNLEKQDVYHFVFHKRHEQMLYNIIANTNFVEDLNLIPAGYDKEYPFFLLAVKENLQTVVKALLEKGVDIDYPLQEFDDDKILRLFSKNEIGKTALMIAYKEKHLDMVELLLEYNANVNARDKNNWTIIDIAKDNNDKTMLRKFRLYAE